MALDPVCGMTVDPARAAGHVDHEGTTYHFCSKGCVAKFTADPKKYLSGAREPMATAPAPVLLTIGGLKRDAASPHAERSNRATSTAAPPHVERSNRRTAETEYVCPMDPGGPERQARRLSEVRHGARAARRRRSTTRPNPELVDMTRRFWIGVALGAPVFVLTMGDMLTRRSARPSASARRG